MPDLERLSDDELTERLTILVKDECRSLAEVIRHLSEFDRRRLHDKKGHGDTFSYCHRVLGYSEDAAYKRIMAARAAKRFPSVINRLRDGRISLTAAALLARHLTAENHRGLLDWACGKTRREIEERVARLFPPAKAASTDVVRHLGAGPPVQSANTDAPSLFDPPAAPPLGNGPPSSEGAGPASPSREAGPHGPIPAQPQRVRFAFTADETLLQKLDRAREVLKHRYPAGHLEDIFGAALDELLEKKDPERRLRRKRALRRVLPRREASENGRRIPQWVKDEVWARDGGRCAFPLPAGERCPERGGLEFDHVVPFALGGPSHDPRNIRLLCRGHNQLMARRLFGEAAVRP